MGDPIRTGAGRAASEAIFDHAGHETTPYYLRNMVPQRGGFPGTGCPERPGLHHNRSSCFDQKNTARDLTNKYNTQGHEKIEKQTVPRLTESVQSLTTKQKAKASEKRLIQKREIFVKQKVSEAKQSYNKSFQLMSEPTAKMEKFDEHAARRAAERRWSEEHKQEAKRLKTVESRGLTVPPLTGR